MKQKVNLKINGISVFVEAEGAGRSGSPISTVTILLDANRSSYAMVHARAGEAQQRQQMVGGLGCSRQLEDQQMASMPPDLFSLPACCVTERWPGQAPSSLMFSWPNHLISLNLNFLTCKEGRTFNSVAQ